MSAAKTTPARRGPKPGRPFHAGRPAQLLAYIIAYKRSHDGNSPNLRQMCDGTGITSTSVLCYYLDKLERAGKIKIGRGDARSISIPGARWLPPEMEV